MAASLALAAGLLQGAPAAAADLPQALTTFLRGYLGPPSGGAPVRVALAWSDLDGDGAPEAVAYVAGGSWCGAGGCLLLVLQRQGEGFHVRGRTTAARPPIGLLATRSRGWRDLAVNSAGAGDPVGRTAVIAYDGVRYASSPTAAPARPIEPEAWAQALIVPSDAGTPLYEPR